MHGQGQETVAFAGYALDLRQGTLRDAGGNEISLRLKTFNLLCYLAENAGRLLPKDELVAAIWPGVVVGDDSLAQCVSELRKALNDTERRIVRTISRRGYLFATPITDGYSVPDNKAQSGAEARKRYRADAVTPAAEPASAGDRPGPTWLTLPDKPSIAVLPFTNLSSDPEQEYFADGMVEEIITALSRIRWLFVIARNSSFTYKAQAVDIKRVGRELGVRYVLEGSVRKSAERVRISGQLIDATNAAHIWAENFDGSLAEIFELQERVAAAVAGVIEPRLRLDEIARANRKPTHSLDAYDLYLRALGHFHKFTGDEVAAAITLLQEALAIDPDYAPAAALTGECYVTRQSHGGARISEAEREHGVILARRAVRLGKDDPEALWMAAITLSILAAEHALAADIVERSLELNPNSAHAWNACGFIQLYRNLPEAAIISFERAIRLSPVDPLSGYFHSGLAQGNLALGRHVEALAWADKTLLQLADYVPAVRTKIVCCMHLGFFGEARALARRLVERHPDLTVARWKTTALKYLPHDALDDQVRCLRAAGIPA
jgi:TolB-like protein/DNA-binding winged helix-turn-helix (wHTH) protein/Tfp pilus assembly protein PilF